MARKEKLVAGSAVRTNAKYAKLISATPREGVLVKELTWISGLWRVRLTSGEEWQIHEGLLERVKKQ